VADEGSDTDFGPFHKLIAYKLQYALDKVRPPVKPGVSHGAILKNVSVVGSALFPDKNASTDTNRSF
jgi:hypothetical protein